MSDYRVDIDRTALKRIVEGPDGQRFFGTVGKDIRDRARSNARGISSKTDAIIHEVGVDADGLHVDIGYAKHHPGFFLWWWEVGTVNHGPRPHLRPAVRPI